MNSYREWAFRLSDSGLGTMVSGHQYRSGEIGRFFALLVTNRVVYWVVTKYNDAVLC